MIHIGVSMNVREFKIEDLDRLRMWLEQDFIRKFWGDPQDWIFEITENIKSDWVKYFIVESNHPIGFLQYYETDKAPLGEWSNEPIGSVGIDYLIGESKYLGKGLGSEMIRLLVNIIKSTHKYDYIVADPVSENIVSAKVLESNGFTQNANGLYSLDLVQTGVKIYRADQSDADEITRLFRDTIQSINSTDYSELEIEAWSSAWLNFEKWQQKIESQYFLKATKDNKIVGFSSLTPDGYLDLMYTHKDYHQQGIASNLLGKTERKAKEQGNTEIFSDVSITAREFFERHGFVLVTQQANNAAGKLINYRMIKKI